MLLVERLWLPVRVCAIGAFGLVALAGCGTAERGSSRSQVACESEATLTAVTELLPGDEVSPGWTVSGDFPYDGCGDEDMTIPNVTREFRSQGGAASSPSTFYDDVVRSARAEGWTMDRSCGVPLLTTGMDGSPLVLRLSRVNSSKLTVGIYAPDSLDDFCDYFFQ